MSAHPWQDWRRFALHYLEMTIVMFVGMMAFAPLWHILFSALGFPAPQEMPTVHVLLMAFDMTVAMVAWMAWRKHSRGAVLEMGAAMFVPFAVLLVPYWLGLLDYGAVMGIGHALMFAGMLAAMLRRKPEYMHHHDRAAVAA